MCFSAEASFIAAGTLSLISIATVQKAHKSNALFLAVIPLFFGIQQGLEGVVWLALKNGDTTSIIYNVAVYGFIFFASVFWPAYIPFSLYKMERDQRRKIVLKGLAIAGTFLAFIFCVTFLYTGISATISSHHIAYSMSHCCGESDTLCYIIGLCLYCVVVVGPMFVSSLDGVWLFGLLTIVGFVVAKAMYAHAFGSVWCFFGALDSILIYCMVHRYTTTPRNEELADTLNSHSGD